MPTGLSEDIYTHLSTAKYELIVVFGAPGAGGNAVGGWHNYGKVLPGWEEIGDPFPTLVSELPTAIPGTDNKRWVHFIKWQENRGMRSDAVEVLISAAASFAKEKSLREILMMGVSDIDLGDNTALNDISDRARVHFMWGCAEKVERAAPVRFTLTLNPPNALFIQRMKGTLPM